MKLPDFLQPLAGRSDLQLLERARAGQVKASRQLVQSLGPPAYALAYRMLGNAQDAEDVMQEGLVRLWTGHSFKGNARLSTYFHVVISRLCLDRLAVEKRVDLDPTPDESAWGVVDSAEVDFSKHQTAEKIELALTALPPRQRLAVVLWAYHDASMADIASALSIEVNAAHQLLHRAKVQLRQSLGDAKHGSHIG